MLHGLHVNVGSGNPSVWQWRVTLWCNATLYSCTKLTILGGTKIITSWTSIAVYLYFWKLLNEAEYDVRIMTSHQFGIICSFLRCHLGGRRLETSSGVGKCRLFSQASTKNAIIRNATIHGFYNINVLKKYIFMYIHTDCYVTLQLHIIRDLKIRRPWRERELHKSNRFNEQNNNFARA